jgi:hypothetical protein
LHVSYIHQNPVKERFCERVEEFPYSSAYRGFELDPKPQGLKPEGLGEPGTARLEAVPFQSSTGKTSNPEDDSSVLSDIQASSRKGQTA